MKINLLPLFLLCFIGACKDDIVPVEGQFSEGIWILNEGSFGQGNASISHIAPDATLTANAFEQVNGYLLGDVAQSIAFLGEKAYIVVNNSQKIEVVDAATMKVQDTWQSTASPRYLLPINSTEAYISHIFSQEVAHISLENGNAINTIALLCDAASTCWSEQMLLINGKIFVANMFKGEINIINPQSKQIEESISVGIDPNSMVIDANDKLWVLCDGGFCPACSEKALYRINPASRQIEGTFLFENDLDYPNNLNISNNGQDLFFINNNGIYKMNIAANNLPTSPVFSGGTYLYTIAIQPETNDLYVSDALDFSQNGFIYKINGENYAIADTFKVGIAPSKIYFK